MASLKEYPDNKTCRFVDNAGVPCGKQFPRKYNRDIHEQKQHGIDHNMILNGRGPGNRVSGPGGRT